MITPTPSMLLEASVALPELPGWVTGAAKPHIATAMQAYAREHEANVRAELARSARAVPDDSQYFWLVELFHRGDTGNSLGRYHTGFTDLSHRSRSTEKVYEAKRYDLKAVAEKIAGDMNKYGHLAALEWRAFQHGFTTATALPAVTPQVADEGRGEPTMIPAAWWDWTRGLMPKASAAVAFESDLERGHSMGWNAALASVRERLQAEHARLLAATPPLMAAVPDQTGEVARLREALQKTVVMLEAWHAEFPRDVGHHEAPVLQAAHAILAQSSAAASLEHRALSAGEAKRKMIDFAEDVWQAGKDGFRCDSIAPCRERRAAAEAAIDRLAALAHSPTVASPALVAEVGEDTKRLDFLQSWADKSVAQGFKWDNYVFTNDTPIREQLDAALAASPVVIACARSA